MAIFGRRSARQRLRSAARESLAIPAFSGPVDCSAWVLNGLWPAELATVTAETAPLAHYLNADLQRIAASTNDKLAAISRAGLVGPARQAAEARVINVARAFAVLRVESTVRQLHRESLELRAEYFSLTATPPVPAPDRGPDEPDPGHSETHRHRRFESTGGVVIDETGSVQHTPDTVAGGPVRTEPVAESEDRRLQRLLAFVARQQPGLRWAIGSGAGRILLVTDLAEGWIPPGVVLPAEVRLLEPGRRTGDATALLGSVVTGASYIPGDRLAPAADFGPTPTSVAPRELPPVDDLGWQLAEATHWRDDLPRMTNTLAKAGAAGTGVVDAEMDLLRVHLDTARYQLLAQYPHADGALLLNCMLLAATEAIATGDRVAANYHFSWFQALSAPGPSRWDPA
ncbi:DUF5631 domain-containing protein [Mycobacterium sp. M1]|uniref:DUF5631 domain-containing protein n=1 Tax=Mycolicibacter acidiphilus TaxID=2835306 RepID=A0ABS5RHI7_9MYCO|nr:DUF5631 domain-containing protein [Mycolicibacter acidiphilus]MBS9533735.1 DUF5631 domain-containing protein [Mycolicibacter acidiphilus]